MVIKDGITYAYDNKGLLIWKKENDGTITHYDPLDTTEPLALSNLVFDYSDINDIKSQIPGFILNDTQKQMFSADIVVIKTPRLLFS